MKECGERLFLFSKRAQLTLFVIVGVVIVLGVAATYFFTSDSFFPITYDEEVVVLKNNILDCFEESYSYAIEVNAHQGGYNAKPRNEYYDLGVYFIPYYYYEGENNFPSLEEVTDQLHSQAKGYFTYCIDSAANDTFEFSYDDFTIDSEFYEDKVSFTAKLKLTTSYNDKTVIVDFKDDEIIIDTKLLAIHNLAQVIVDQALNDPEEWIDLTEIYAVANAADLNVTILDIDEDDASYLFIIKPKQAGFVPTSFQFLNKYNLIDIPFPASPDLGSDNI